MPAVDGEPEGIFGQLLSNLPKYVMMYLAINYFTSSFKQLPNEQISSHSTDQKLSAINSANSRNNHLPNYRFGEKFEFKFYISKSEKLDKSARLLVSKSVVLGEYAPFQEEFKVDCDHHLKNNGSLYAHYLLDHQDEPVYFKKLLTRYMPRKKVVIKKRLVADKTDGEFDEATVNQKEIISYWWNNVTINLVQMQEPIPSSSPPQILKSLRLLENGNYLPIFSQNDFWMLSENLQPINQSCTKLTLSFSWEPLSFWKFQMYTQFDESFKMQSEMMGADISESDTVKRMFLDTNPYLLAVTICVSILHSVFDFLAFKNDISFWKDKKNMEGMSLRTIVLNIIFQTITLLYLLDNDTSYMILVSSGIGILIETWKINKTMITSRIPSFPYIRFTERYSPSKLTRKTQKYDRVAFNYLSYALFPLMVAYTAYSLVYESHKSWYSFVIGTMVGFVYTFGFISMTPQLFINYKLKSVAHMPGKTFMYKALNTFIDDLFAFVIKMPWLHRLACLRDDLVFFVYLYQRWIYKEDKRRRNEFGQVGEDDQIVDDEDLLSSEDELLVTDEPQNKTSVKKSSETGDFATAGNAIATNLAKDLKRRNVKHK